MIADIEYRLLSSDSIELNIVFSDGKTVSMCMPTSDLHRLCFFLDCLSMELDRRHKDECR